MSSLHEKKPNEQEEDARSSIASLSITNTTTIPETKRIQQQHVYFQPNMNSVPRFCTRTYKINNSILTHIWIQQYNDTIVVGISQLPTGAISNYILCQSDLSTTNHSGSIAALGFNDGIGSTRKRTNGGSHIIVSHLLGSSRDDPLLAVYARRIWESLIGGNQNYTSCNGPTTLLLGLSLARPNNCGHDTNTTTTSPVVETTSSPTTTSTAMFHKIVELVVQLYHESTMID